MRKINFLIARLCGLAITLAFCTSTPVSAFTFQVIHDFTGGKDGSAPGYNLLSGKRGFIGTAFGGGANGNGIVFNLKQKTSGWTVKPIYNFADTDGAPGWGVTRANGSLYTNASYAGVFG